MEKYNRLTVLEKWLEPTKSGKRKTIAKCKCECGTIRDYDYSSVKNGHTKSCGCLSKERLIERNTKHGLRHNKFASKYYDMLYRCYKKSHKGYQNYGGRGITVCDEWKNDIAEFVKWAEEQPYEKGWQLDRINNDLGYSPENCHFVPVKENLMNRRNTIRIGEMSLSEYLEALSKETGIFKDTLRSRYFKLKKYGIEVSKENLTKHIDIRTYKREQANQLPLRCESGERFND